MTTFSVGVLYSAQKFLELTETNILTVEAFLESFRTYHVADADAVLNVAQMCSWVSVDSAGVLKITDAGKKVRLESDEALQLRVQLVDIIFQLRPAWAKRLQHGRSEAVKTMPPDIEQIFIEAGLLGDLTLEIVGWWDRLSLAARSAKNETNNKIGRDAERLSIDYERKRTHADPKWQCMESNFSGYDILSVIKKGAKSPLLIEVKGSVLPKAEAFFYLSRNEWEVAITSGDYCLHLWLMKNPLQPIVVDVPTLKAHVAGDKGAGKWDVMKIPFKTFS